MSKIPTANGIPVPPITSAESPDKVSKKKHGKAKEATGGMPSRFKLKMQAGLLRSGQYIGMSLHFLASPRPPNPSFVKKIPSTLSHTPGNFELHFYTPEGYKEAGKDGRKFPAVVNYHGGGFTIGSATDDARFARFVLETCNAVFVSVEYRLAPECPFNVAVDDAADALLWLIQHASEYHIDPERLATSGFSAGANLAITSTLRLTKHLKDLESQNRTIASHRIRAIATWYPITDYTLSREIRRATSKRPDQTLPPTLTTLFDASYLFPPELDLANPFLSPSKASDDELIESIPADVIFYTCEWDMLLREGEELANRLRAPPINKNVHYKMIPEVPHGWDKAPDPIRPAAGSEALYQECCDLLKAIFDKE